MQCKRIDAADNRERSESNAASQAAKHRGEESTKPSHEARGGDSAQTQYNRSTKPQPETQRRIKHGMGCRGLHICTIKVETSVARRPPRRSRRAELPHRAPQECAQVELQSWLSFVGRDGVVLRRLVKTAVWLFPRCAVLVSPSVARLLRSSSW